MGYTKYHSAWADSPSTSTPVTAAALDYIESGIAAAAYGPPAVFVAASDAPTAVQARADYVCTGTDDQDTVASAWTASQLSATPSGQFGTVLLSAGTFYLTGPVLMPGRGAALMGQGLKTELRINATYSTFAANATGGQGADPALIMAAATGAGQNATNLLVSRLSLNGAVWSGSAWTARGVGAVILDQTDGGSTTASSYGTYGWPTTITGGDTYNRVTDCYFGNVTYGIRFVGGGSTNSRGNNVHNTRGYNVSVAGYSTSSASDSHFDQCHCITSTASSASGFLGGGGNTRFTGCKASYFNSTGAAGFTLSSSRCSAVGCESQDCYNGVVISGADGMWVGGRVETQASSNIAFNVTGDNAVVSGLYVHVRSGGSWVRGLHFGSASHDHHVQAMVDPTSITTAVSVNSGSEITDTANLPAGVYGIRVTGTRSLSK